MVVVGANDRGGHTPTTRMIQCESQEPQQYDLGCAQTIQFVEWAILFDMTTVRHGNTVRRYVWFEREARRVIQEEWGWEDRVYVVPDEL